MIQINKDFANIPSSLHSKTPKIDDEVKLKLAEDQFNKCCYCEDSHIKGTVEHFLPKSKYPNQKYEWENLLWACNDCNNFKSNKTVKIINPLTTPNPENLLEFETNGQIKSTDSTMNETIKVCDLKRKNLNLKRKAIFDDLIRNIEFVKHIGVKENVIEYYLLHFVQPIKTDKELNFVAFRKFIVENYSNDILKDK